MKRIRVMLGWLAAGAIVVIAKADSRDLRAIPTIELAPSWFDRLYPGSMALVVWIVLTGIILLSWLARNFFRRIRRVRHARLIFVRITIPLFLLLGAVVNVGVAWGLALIINVTMSNNVTIGHQGSPTESWNLIKKEAFGSEHYRSDHAKGSWTSTNYSIGITLPISSVVPYWGDFESTDEAYSESPNGLEMRMIEARGWPWRTMWGVPVIAGPGIRDTPYGVISTPFPNWESPPVKRVLPAIPIWPGFIANTVFYATLLWLLTLGPFRLRRQLRLERGLCVKCAYDLKGAAHEVCPECGAEIAPNNVGSAVRTG